MLEDLDQVSYNLGTELTGDENPGEFDPINSAGQIIAQKHFPDL